MEEPKVKPQHKLVAKYFLTEAAGNAEKAVILAGYSKKYARGHAYKVVAHPAVQSYMEYLLNEAMDDPEYHIASVKETQAFWTATMNDASLRVRDRLRASELLAKVQGQFRKEDDW